MTNFTKSYLLCSFLLIFSFGNKTNAQNCPSPNQFTSINGKDIKSTMGNGGSVFGYSIDEFYGIIAPIPTTGIPTISSLTNQHIWIGSQESNGDLKLSVTTPNKNDFSAGPILIENNPPTLDCENYNKIWKVTGEEIILHVADFEDNGIIDQPIPSIYSYPGFQNPFFFDWNGFSLPNSNQEMAPFFDQNTDGIYNPTDGDFPLPEALTENNIPLEMAWSVSNDADNNFIDSGVDSLMIELHSTMWTLYCDNDSLLDNAIFTSQKIINRGSQDLNSVSVGYSSKTSVGCPYDDFIASIPDLNTYYQYNIDQLDGTTGCSCIDGFTTYCDVIPAQAITFLNQEMSSFMFHGENPDQNLPYSNPPELPIDFWNLMNSQWTGTPLTFGEDGINNANPTTKFAFPEYPFESTGWSMTQNSQFFHYFEVGHLSSIASVEIENLSPGESERIDMVYTFHRPFNQYSGRGLDLIYENVPLLQQKYDNDFDLNCGFTVGTHDENLNSNSIQIFPNPCLLYTSDAADE